MEDRTDSGPTAGSPAPAGASAALVEGLNRLILEAHPTTQAVYRYGTWATAAQRADSERAGIRETIIGDARPLAP